MPSVLPADFSKLGDECRALEDAGVDRIQWDIMDGQFVPNITVGPDVIAAVRPHVALPFEAHLMVRNPDPMLSRWVDAGCEMLIVHAESTARSAPCEILERGPPWHSTQQHRSQLSVMSWISSTWCW